MVYIFQDTRSLVMMCSKESFSGFHISVVLDSVLHFYPKRGLGGFNVADTKYVNVLYVYV